MAFGVGFIIGLVVCRAGRLYFFPNIGEAEIDQVFLYISLTAAFALLFAQQFVLGILFWGKRRGELEYALLEKSAEHGKQGPELAALLKKVKSGVKLSDADSPHEQLKAATRTFTKSVVVYFNYAVTCERLGFAEEAIAAYETAKALLPNSAAVLKSYVEAQASRVKQHGPSQTPTVLRHIVY